MAKNFEPFGKYTLLDLMTEGGMAEIYRARLRDGSDPRVFIIKKIQKSYSERAEFQHMFWSEITVSMRFKHPNIVRLFDFGEEEGQPYIAMEYVKGTSLRALLRKYDEKKERLPMELSAYIVQQSADALHYAHFFKDHSTGEILNLIHRDVSPQNILLSYNGEVKLIDFGIAKASLLDERTRTGTLKGKPCYMAPEYIAGKKIDGRYDLFALGVILWELLTGKRLFSAPSDVAVLGQVQNCDKHIKPPSFINPLVPRELDSIVLKALAKDPDQRYATVAEFSQVLKKYLALFHPEFSPVELSTTMDAHFTAEKEREESQLSSLLNRAKQYEIANTLGVVGELSEEDYPDQAVPHFDSAEAVSPPATRASTSLQSRLQHRSKADYSKPIPIASAQDRPRRSFAWVAALGVIAITAFLVQNKFDIQIKSREPASPPVVEPVHPVEPINAPEVKAPEVEKPQIVDVKPVEIKPVEKVIPAEKQKSVAESPPAVVHKPSKKTLKKKLTSRKPHVKNEDNGFGAPDPMDDVEADQPRKPAGLNLKLDEDAEIKKIKKRDPHFSPQKNNKKNLPPSILDED